MILGTDSLNNAQRLFVDAHLGSGEVVADHSWGQLDTVVLEVVTRDGRFIVKAGGPTNNHLIREIQARRTWVSPWLDDGRIAPLIAFDEDHHIAIMRYLPGRLVEGSPAQDHPDMYRQAGRLSAAFHAQFSAFDPTWNTRLRERALRFLSSPHRIDLAIEKRVRKEVDSWPTGGATVVPTHGDWQPRNWLDDDGTLRVIDLGRASLRVPEEDFVRLARQDFLRNPQLESAYLEGYGVDPREPAMWRRMNVAEAVGTATWAFSVGDEEFEAVGHAQLARLYPA